MLKNLGGTNYSFDAAHRLTSQGNQSYLYDGLGNRIRANRNGSVTRYVHDGQGRVIALADDNKRITHYVIHGQGVSALVDAVSGQTYSYHFDGTGHTVAITNASGQTVNTYAYDPYGRVVGQTETIPQPSEYAGQFGVMAEGNNLY